MHTDFNQSMREPNRYYKWFKRDSEKQVYRLEIWNVGANAGQIIFLKMIDETQSNNWIMYSKNTVLPLLAQGKTIFPPDGELIQLNLYWTSRGYRPFTAF